MDKLWAPWRIGFLSKVKKNRRCIFCAALKSKNDEKTYVLFRNKFCFSILNKYPYNNGHCMIVPNRHVESVEKLSTSELVDIMESTKGHLVLLRKILNPGGFNVGFNIGKVSGAGIVGHVHLHIVPRWLGDSNFMPVVSDIKVISQSLDELYKLLICAGQKKSTFSRKLNCQKPSLYNNGR